MAFKYLSQEWEEVRDILFYSGTNMILGYCNALASDIVESWDGKETNISQIISRDFSLREVPVYTQEQIKDYLTQRQA